MAFFIDPCDWHSLAVKLRVCAPSETTVACSQPLLKPMTSSCCLLSVLVFISSDARGKLSLDGAKIVLFSETSKLFITFLHICPTFIHPTPATAAGGDPARC